MMSCNDVPYTPCPPPILDASIAFAYIGTEKKKKKATLMRAEYDTKFFHSAIYDKCLVTLSVYMLFPSMRVAADLNNRRNSRGMYQC